MISIGKPYITIEHDTAYLRAPVQISEDAAKVYLEKTAPLKNTAWLTSVDYPPAVWQEEGSSLWFSAPAQYADYLCDSRSNAFVIAMLWYAMITGSDIRFEAPLSRKLADGLTQRLVPALVPADGRQMRLDGPVTDVPVACAGGVLTGMSCGVDSLYTLHCYDRPDAPNGLRLTHLAYYDCNYLLPRLQPPYDIHAIYREKERVFSHIIDHAGIIAAHHDLPLIVMRSNLDEDFYRGGRIYGSMYRFLACTLALEHLYGTYISSSSGHNSDMVEVSLTVPTQHYEGLITDCCQTETLHYVPSDDASRPEKLQALADDEDAQKYVAVCYDTGKKGENCGRCYACMKTMIPLDIMGRLDRFEASFDLGQYYPHREEVFRDLILFSQRPEASSARETVQQILQLADRYDNKAGRLFRAVYDRYQTV